MAGYWVTDVRGNGGYAEPMSLDEAIGIACYDSRQTAPCMIRDDEQKPIYLALDGVIYHLQFIPIAGNEYRLKHSQIIYRSPDYQTHIGQGNKVKIIQVDGDSVTASFRIPDGETVMLYLGIGDLLEGD